MKKRIIQAVVVIALGVFLSLIWQSTYCFETWPSYMYTANLNAYFVYTKACEYFSGAEEKVTGVFIGELSDSDPIGKYFCGEYYASYGYYYLMVKDSDVVQCYWQYKNNLAERANELTAALEKGEPPTYINAGGDYIGGSPGIVRECRPLWQRIYDELPYIAFGYIPLFVLLALYILALLLRPFAGRIWKRFIGKLR